MGTALSPKIIPPHDERILKTMELSQISDLDIAYLYDHFQSIQDKSKICYDTKPDHIHVDAFFDEIDEPRSKYGNCLF